MAATFDPDLIHAIFNLVWTRKTLEDREKSEGAENLEIKEEAGTSKKNRPTTANSNALKVSCEFLRLFVTEAVQRAAVIAEAEGTSTIEGTHLERILPQLLLDF